MEYLSGKKFVMVRYFDNMYHVKLDPNVELLREWKSRADGVSFVVDLENPINDHDVNTYLSPQNPDITTKHEKADGKLEYLPHPLYKLATTKYAVEEIVESLRNYRMPEELFIPICEGCQWRPRVVDFAEPLNVEVKMQWHPMSGIPNFGSWNRGELDLVKIPEPKFVKLYNAETRRSIFIRWTTNEINVRQFYVDLKQLSDEYWDFHYLTLDITKKYRRSDAKRNDVVKDCLFNYGRAKKRIMEERKHEHLMRLFKESGIEPFVVDE